EWAGSEAFLTPLRKRLRTIGLTRKLANSLIEQALADPSWCGLAAIDAGTRMIASLQSSGALSRRRGFQTLAALTDRQAGSPSQSIAEQYWSVRSKPADDPAAETLMLRGAVLVSVKGRRPDRVESRTSSPLSPELSAALNEPPVRPLSALWHALVQDGALTPTIAIV